MKPRYLFSILFSITTFLFAVPAFAQDTETRYLANRKVSVARQRSDFENETGEASFFTEHPWIAVKDPSIVKFENKWHLFCTLRKAKQGNGRIRIGYCSFKSRIRPRTQTGMFLI